MRKLMALAIVFTLGSASTSWALFGLGDVSFDGSLEVSGNSANNEEDQSAANDHRGGVLTRTRVGMNAQVTEGVKSRIEIIRSPSGSAGTSAQYGRGPSTIQNEQDNFDIHNAYVEFENLWGQIVRLGRQYVGNPGDLVWNISPKDDDSLTPNSIDGLLVQNRKYDFLHIDLFTGKANEDDAITDTDDGTGAGDVNLSSLDLVLPKLVPNAKVNVGYLWGVDSSSSPSKNDNKLTTIRVGINGGVKENLLTYRAEYFMNGGQNENPMGSDTKYKGTAIDLGVGVNPAETNIGTFALWANWLMASGDDTTTDNDDDSFHDFTQLGFNTSDRLLGEIFGKSNTLSALPLGQGLDSGAQGAGRDVMNLGVSLKPKAIEKTTFKLDYYIFKQTEDNVNNVNIGDKFGNEIDLAYIYDHSDNVGIELGYAMLSPDDALIGVGAANDEDITKMYARTKIKWGGVAQ